MTSESDVRTEFLSDEKMDQDEDEDEIPLMGEGCELPLSFDIGARVACRDGSCGRLTRLVVDPVTDGVTDLIVEKGFLQKHDRVVPVSSVASVADGQIRLALDSKSLKDLPEYREVEFRVPSLGWDSSRHKPEDVRHWMTGYGGVGEQSVVPVSRQHFNEGVAFGSKVIGHGTKVYCLRGTVGEVDHVLVDCAAGHITHLVVKRSIPAEYHIVPIGMVSAVDDGGVTLNVTRDQVLALPRFHPRD